MTIQTNSSLNLKNLIKTSKNFSLGFVIAISSISTGNIKAEETPDLCKDVLGTFNSSTGAYSKSASEIAADGTYFCAGTPDRFELSIYEMGLCTSNPIEGSPKAFSKKNCVESMVSTAGVTADLAGTTVDLPSAASRPANNTYTYAYIVIKNTFGLRGSLKISDGLGGVNQYCSTSDGSSTSAAASCTPVNHTETLSSFDEIYSPDFGPAEMPSGGEVSAILTDSSLVRSTTQEGVERLIGVFATNSGTPVVINDSVAGLEVELQVTDAGYGIQFDSNTGDVIDFGSMPFKPVFTTY
tara:strand:- start:279 stop:1169 length:891 start_codon:yes stop_codon:yes gene_type:complete